MPDRPLAWTNVHNPDEDAAEIEKDEGVNAESENDNDGLERFFSLY